MNTWKRPENLPIVDKLKDVTERLNEALPKLYETQAKAVANMAKTAVLSTSPTQSIEEENDA